MTLVHTAEFRSGGRPPIVHREPPIKPSWTELQPHPNLGRAVDPV